MEKKQINITIPMDIYEMIVEEAGIRQSKLKKVCPLSVIVNEIFEPAARAHFNGHNPIDNKQDDKPLLGACKEGVIIDDKAFEDDKPVEQTDSKQDAKPSSDPYADVNIFGSIGG